MTSGKPDTANVEFYRKRIKSCQITALRLQRNATSSTEVQCWVGQGENKLRVCWNGPSQMTSLPSKNQSIIHYPQQDDSNMIWRDARWHTKEMEKYPSLCLISPTYWHTGAHCTQNSILNRRICSFDFLRLLFPPPWCICLSSSATYSPKISTKRCGRKEEHTQQNMANKWGYICLYYRIILCRQFTIHGGLLSHIKVDISFISWQGYKMLYCKMKDS